ncbi:MAG TPA: hypothetical protein VMJ10_13090 [Kofleriaceae bacterium]|nr:hypothetical protein [Kofleriaceae bacterium]
MLSIYAVGVMLMVLGTLLVYRGVRARQPVPIVLVRPEWSLDPIAVAAAQRELDRELDQLLVDLDAQRQAQSQTYAMHRAFARPQTPTNVLMPRIEAYIREAMAATGATGTPPEPLPRVRAARGSQAPEIHAVDTVEIGETLVLHSVLRDEADYAGDALRTLPLVRRGRT